MTKFRLHIILFAMITLGCTSEDPEPGETFLKYYGVKGAQVGFGMVYLEDSDEIVLYGSQTDADSSHSDLLLMRVDMNGNQIGTQSYDLTEPADDGRALFNDLPGSVKRYGDLLYYVGASVGIAKGVPFSSLTWAIFDLDFQLLNNGWINVLDNNGARGDVAGRDLILDGSHLIIAGTSNVQTEGDPLNANGNRDQQIYLARLDPVADSVLEARTRGSLGDDDVLYIDEFAPNNFVVIGTTRSQSASQGTNVLAMALNEILIPIGSRDIELTVGSQTNRDEEPQGVHKRPSGYVVTGASVGGGSTFPFFANISYDGGGGFSYTADTVSVVNATGGTSNGSGGAITFSPIGNYFIVGSMPTDDKLTEIMVAQTDQSGAAIPSLQRNYGRSDGNDLGNDVLVSPDGNLFVLTTVDFGGNETLMGLMKVNNQGDLMR